METWKEKFTFFWEILTGIFNRKKVLEFDIRKVPAKTLVKKLVSKVKKNYPNVYKVLITERNEIMSSNLLNISKENPDKKILAVLGAGHIDGMLRILKSN